MVLLQVENATGKVEEQGIWIIVSSWQAGSEHSRRAAGSWVGLQGWAETMEKMPEAQCVRFSYLFEVYALPWGVRPGDDFDPSFVPTAFCRIGHECSGTEFHQRMSEVDGEVPHTWSVDPDGWSSRNMRPLGPSFLCLHLTLFSPAILDSYSKELGGVMGPWVAIVPGSTGKSQKDIQAGGKVQHPGQDSCPRQHLTLQLVHQQSLLVWGWMMKSWGLAPGEYEGETKTPVEGPGNRLADTVWDTQRHSEKIQSQNERREKEEKEPVIIIFKLPTLLQPFISPHPGCRSAGPPAMHPAPWFEHYDSAASPLRETG